MLIKIRFALTGINVIINQIRFDTSWKEAYIWEDFCLQLDGPITRGGGGAYTAYGIFFSPAAAALGGSSELFPSYNINY